MQIQILAEDRAGRHLAALAQAIWSVGGDEGKRVTCDLCGGTGEVWGR